MQNLIIGKTAQLNFYFPDNYLRISSRNINFNEFADRKFDCVYILFAEQRTFLNEKECFFTDINVDYTLKVVNFFKEISNKVVIYSTSELWNDYEGEIEIIMPFKYNYSPYIKSKEILSTIINENKNLYKNVYIIYPFNFNSPWRKEGFLFFKIFNCILNKEKISIGDINMQRDIIHPQIIVNESINTDNDKLIGTGFLINIKKYIEDIFISKNMIFDDYVICNISNNLLNTRKEYYSKIKYSSYSELLNLTLNDIEISTNRLKNL
jgi:nucleoside-diphosphate-sugar epimerase